MGGQSGTGGQDEGTSPWRSRTAGGRSAVEAEQREEEAGLQEKTKAVGGSHRRRRCSGTEAGPPG